MAKKKKRTKATKKTGQRTSAGKKKTVRSAGGENIVAGMKLPRKTEAQRARAREIFKALKKEYPDAQCELDYHNPVQLLVSTILSAQATDVGVNRATPALFRRFETAHDFAAARPEEIEPYIASIGLFRNKSKAIVQAMQTVCDKFDGRIPDTMEGLLQLRGVARKTANVVLGNAFHKNEGVVVDTHVMRLAQRFGLTKHNVPAKIELDLMALFDRRNWCLLSHLLVWHGRRVCKARSELCATHPICIRYCSRSKELRHQS